MNGASSICACDSFVSPQVISNPPGRNSISYRVGDFLSFREALLRSRPGEAELANWRPGAQSDLAVQMVEWWAYLADVLTFYNERIANENYLRTAGLPESVKRLIRILGYRPRPGIGGTGILAALMTGIKPFTLPQGFQIQSKPGPGKQPQVYELDAATQVGPPDSFSGDPPPTTWVTNDNSIRLKGVVGSIKPGDELVVMERGWDGSDSNYAVVTVNSVTPLKNPRGTTDTSLTLDQPSAAGQSIALLQVNGPVTNYRLLRNSLPAHVWQYPDSNSTLPVIAPDHIELASINRGIKVGDPILLEIGSIGSSSYAAQLLSVTSYSESIWYANPVGGVDPSIPPITSPPIVPIPITHSCIGFTPLQNIVSSGNEAKDRKLALVRFGWQDAGTLVPIPADTLSGTSITLTAPLPDSMLPMTNQLALLSDRNGKGVAVAVKASDPLTLGLSNPDGPSDATWNSELVSLQLAAPLSVLFDPLVVSRGKTVQNEILGSGDATITTGQEFTLQKSPLTYLQSATSSSGSGYTSTLQVWVDGVEWQEAPSFFEQSASAKVFVTREDEKNVTHVQFGDGVNGARLPSGVNNVVASYRYGSGAENPDAGSLTVVLKPWPGLKAVANPVPAGGGSDPDPPEQIKRYAPQSVLTFGRAVSADDYEVIAAQAPGVSRARAYWSWDDDEQRMMVKVYVGDDDLALSNAKTALAGAGDPNRPLSLKLAQPVPITLGLTVVVDPAYVEADVKTGVTAALVDADSGLLGANVVQVGQSVFRSQIYQACLNVLGVRAVHDLVLTGATVVTCLDCPECDYRFDTGEGGYFTVTPPADQIVSTEVATNGA